MYSMNITPFAIAALANTENLWILKTYDKNELAPLLRDSSPKSLEQKEKGFAEVLDLRKLVALMSKRFE